MFRTSAILLAVAILPYLVVAQDVQGDGISDWNTTGLEDNLLIGIIAGSIALFFILTIVFCLCCFCFMCPGMCGGCGGFSCFGGQGRQDYYQDEPAPQYFEPPPPAPYYPPEPIQQLPPAHSVQYYPPVLPEPEPQLPVVLSRPPPIREPEYITRDPERRERVVYAVRAESRDRGHYDSDRRVVIARRGSYRGDHRDRDHYDDDRRGTRYVTTRSSFRDSPRRSERSDYY